MTSRAPAFALAATLVGAASTSFANGASAPDIRAPGDDRVLLGPDFEVEMMGSDQESRSLSDIFDYRGIAASVVIGGEQGRLDVGPVLAVSALEITPVLGAIFSNQATQSLLSPDEKDGDLYVGINGALEIEYFPVKPYGQLDFDQDAAIRGEGGLFYQGTGAREGRVFGAGLGIFADTDGERGLAARVELTFQ